VTVNAGGNGRRERGEGRGERGEGEKERREERGERREKEARKERKKERGEKGEERGERRERERHLLKPGASVGRDGHVHRFLVGVHRLHCSPRHLLPRDTSCHHSLAMPHAEALLHTTAHAPQCLECKARTYARYQTAKRDGKTGSAI